MEDIMLQLSYVRLVLCSRWWPISCWRNSKALIRVVRSDIPRVSGLSNSNSALQWEKRKGAYIKTSTLVVSSKTYSVRLNLLFFFTLVGVLLTINNIFVGWSQRKKLLVHEMFNKLEVLCSCLIKSSIKNLFDIVNINKVPVDVCPFKHLHEFLEL